MLRLLIFRLTQQVMPRLCCLRGCTDLPATANVTIELNTNTTGNISNASWTIVVPNTGGMFIADGTNVRANVQAGTPTITLFTVNGGSAVSGTFNT